MFYMFITFVKVGLFSFGGGYSILAMLQQEIVTNHNWLSADEFANIIAISQMTPGPIAINAATFIGYERYGILGSILCTFGVILPSSIVMVVLTKTYLTLQNKLWFQHIFKDLRLLSIGLIAAAMVLIGKSSFPDLFSVIVFIIAFYAGWRWKISPIYMLIGAAIVGMIFG